MSNYDYDVLFIGANNTETAVPANLFAGSQGHL